MVVKVEELNQPTKKKWIQYNVSLEEKLQVISEHAPNVKPAKHMEANEGSSNDEPNKWIHIHI